MKDDKREDDNGTDKHNECQNKYNNYVKMEVFCWSIELPDPSKYGLTLELKPKQKAEDSIIARAQQGL